MKTPNLPHQTENWTFINDAWVSHEQKASHSTSEI